MLELVSCKSAFSFREVSESKEMELTLHPVGVLLGTLDRDHDSGWIMRNHIEIRHWCELDLARNGDGGLTFFSPF